MDLLTRDQFREQVFERDSHKCVICGSPAQDSHHIMERRLFPDGGYYLDNGASLCGKHHIQAETTELSTDAIREAADILYVVLPPHLYSDEIYTKWGDVVRSDGMRLRGELFFDDSVQKILAQGNVLDLYLPYFKYPRTYHFPWSPGTTKDDRIIDDLSIFDGKEVVVSVKMDGENSSLYNNYYHARSTGIPSHPSQNWLKNFHANMCYNIPENWRVCCENLFAEHTIHYKGLESYTYMFSIWNERNECLSWDETVEWSQLLEIPMVPVLYRGEYDEKVIRKLYTPTFDGNDCEGYVMRITDSFPYQSFRYSVAKYVRKDHVGKSHHWRNKPVVPNELK